MVACNAVGDVVDPLSGRILAGARTADGQGLIDTHRAMLEGQTLRPPVPGTNTTIGIIATNARLDKAQAKRLAMSGHDGLARSIRPVHTPFDGDTLFAMATGAEHGPADLLLLSVMAAEATALATVDAIQSALEVNTLTGKLAAAQDGIGVLNLH